MVGQPWRVRRLGISQRTTPLDKDSLRALYVATDALPDIPKNLLHLRASRTSPRSNSIGMCGPWRTSIRHSRDYLGYTCFGSSSGRSRPPPPGIPHQTIHRLSAPYTASGERSNPLGRFADAIVGIFRSIPCA